MINTKKEISKQEAISLREQGNHYETLIWQVHSVILIFSGVILYYFWKEEIHNEFVLFSMLLLGFLLNLYGLVIILNMYSKQQESYKRSNEILTDIFKELSYLRIGIYGDVFIWFFIFCVYLISFFVKFNFMGLFFALLEIMIFLLLLMIKILKKE